MNTTSERIKCRRLEMGISLRELARRLGLSATSVSKWERGDIQNISAVHLHATAKILGCSPAWLLTGDESTSPEPITLDTAYIFIAWSELWNYRGFLEGSSPMARRLPFPGPYKEGCFLTKAKGLGAAPQFREDEALLINTKMRPSDGDFILVLNKSTQRPSIKQYIEEEGVVFLKVINPDFPNRISPMSPEMLIIGVIEASYQNYK